MNNLIYVSGFKGELLYVENNKLLVNPLVTYFNISASKDMKKNDNIKTELY